MNTFVDYAADYGHYRPVYRTHIEMSSKYKKISQVRHNRSRLNACSQPLTTNFLVISW